jgi:hypothetical protein
MLSTAVPAGTSDLKLLAVALSSVRIPEIRLLSPLSARKMTDSGTRFRPQPTSPKIHRVHGSTALAVDACTDYPDSFSRTGSVSVVPSVVSS